jgi:hypothetical protein
MESVIDKVMQTFGMMSSLTQGQLDEARQAVFEFLSNNPEEDEHKATVGALAFLRNWRESL